MLEHLSKPLSQQLFSICRSGKIINRDTIVNDELVSDQIFAEVMTHLDDYIELAEMTGYKLVATSESLYFTGLDPDLKNQPLNFKAKVLLTIIGRYLNMAGKSPSYIKTLDSSSGLTMQDFELMAEMDGIRELLYRSGFATDKEDFMFSAVRTILIDRGFLEEKTSSKSYIATNAGWSWFEQLKQRVASELLD